VGEIISNKLECMVIKAVVEELQRQEIGVDRIEGFSIVDEE